MDEDRVNEIIDGINNFSDKLKHLVNQMHEHSNRTENPYLGKSADIIKVVIASMENPLDLDDLNYILRMYSSHMMMLKQGDGRRENIKEGLIEYYNNHKNDDKR